jgi:histidinol-phosphatase
MLQVRRDSGQGYAWLAVGRFTAHTSTPAPLTWRVTASGARIWLSGTPGSARSYAACMATAGSEIGPSDPAKDDLALAHVMADTADAIAIRHFQHVNLRSSRKADGTPVTEADQLIEATLRKQLERYRPEDAFVGEESGSRGGSGRRWYIDPIDGTASYMDGRLDWRTLIAVEEAETVTTGLVSSPMLRQRWWANHGGGAWTRISSPDEPVQPTRLAVSHTRVLSHAAVAIWPTITDLPEPLRASAARLAAGSMPPAAKLPSSGGTRHGALLVATGLIDAFLFVGMGPWDLAAMVPIVEEAGGRFADVAGGRSLRTTAALFSNGVLHPQSVSVVSAATHDGVRAVARMRGIPRPAKSAAARTVAGLTVFSAPTMVPSRSVTTA